MMKVWVGGAEVDSLNALDLLALLIGIYQPGDQLARSGLVGRPVGIAEHRRVPAALVIVGVVKAMHQRECFLALVAIQSPSQSCPTTVTSQSAEKYLPGRISMVMMFCYSTRLSRHRYSDRARLELELLTGLGFCTRRSERIYIAFWG